MFRDFTIECIAMLAIYTVVIIDFLRRHHKKHALYTLPLTILPLCHLIGICIGNFIIENLLNYNPYRFMISAVLVGIAISAMLIGGVSRTMKSKKASFYYSIITFAYTCVIGIVLVMSMLHSFVNINSLS